MITKEEILKYQNKLKNTSPEEILKWAIDFFKVDNIAFASSLGAEDQVLTDMLMKIDVNVNIFTLDTGRLYQETYDLIAETAKKYNFKFQIIFPEASSVEKLVNENGVNLFYDTIEKRKLCCKVRKLEPLKRKLSGLDAWICGLRKEQSVTRYSLEKIEWDESFNLIKINPLADWSEEQVWEYIKKNNVPYNKLHNENFPSIGCAPCTRSVKPGENIRAGRWWWEEPQKKECGLHLKPVKNDSK